MYETSDIKKGLKVELDGNPYSIVEFQFVRRKFNGNNGSAQ